MKGLFIPDVTVKMFRNASVESVAELMAEGKVYDIDYQEPCEDAINRQSVLDKIEEEIKDTLYVDSLIFGELIDFKNGKIDADDVIEEFNRVTRLEILKIINKYKAESEGKE